MRNSLFRIGLGLAATAVVAALWIIPSRAQVPGTLEKPGMSDARVWVNNKGRNEAIPVTMVGNDGTPVPVSVSGIVETKGTAARQPWDYRSVIVNADQDPTSALVPLGNDGWEAVGVTSQPGGKLTVVLKRPR